jgi:protein-tyrosine phosphatase
VVTDAHKSERRLPRVILDRLDAALHERRRTRAIQQLRKLPKRPGVLFVCHGNVCRSPYAEYAFARLMRSEGEERKRIESAGFIGAGRGSPDEAKAVAAARGLDLEPHVSAPLDLERTGRADLVVVMEPRQRRALHELHGRTGQFVLILGDLDPEPILWRRIRDPWGHDLEFFEEIFDRIDRCLGTMAAALHARTQRPAVLGGERGGLR